MPTDRKKILTQSAIAQKTRRIAYEIVEEFAEENTVIIFGIKEGGYLFAEKLVDELNRIAAFNVILSSVTIDKQNPESSDVTLSLPEDNMKDAVAVVVDDVLNTGKTLAYIIRYLLGLNFKSLKTSVLVNREHLMFPISADFVGLSLSTTMREHIQVVLTKEEESVYLF